MRQRWSLLGLTVCLLCGCAAGAIHNTEPPEPAPVSVGERAEETLTFELVSERYEREILAEDGTKLMEISFQLPHLRALADGEPVETPDTPARQAALERMSVFNGTFDQWRESESTQENAEFAQAHYEMDPVWFGGEQSYSEEFTYTAYQAGDLISVSGSYYNYTGGAHPNTWLLGWNFDLRTGEFFTPETLGGELREAVAAELLRQAQTPDETGAAPADEYWEDYEELLSNWPACAVTFDAEGMNVDFSAYELAPYAAGAQRFRIPYSLMEPYLTPEGRELLGLDCAE